MNKRWLQIQQVDKKMFELSSLLTAGVPTKGWLHGIRTSLGVTQAQLAKRLSVTKQNIQDLEQREAEGTVALKTLSMAANALDMKLVYAIIPKDGTLEALIERRAKELAEEIVGRTNNTMLLEEQSVPYERVKKAIEERTTEFKNEIPKFLWD